MKYSSLAGLVFLLASGCHTPRKVALEENTDRIYIKDPQKKPVFLVGRLPGKSWREHNPARFGALQSFESTNRVKRGVLALYKRSSQKQEALEFLQEMAARMKKQGMQVKDDLQVETREGSWSCLLLASENSLSRICAIKKGSRIFYVQFTTGDADTYALLSPDVNSYLKQFWFLYR